MSREDTVIGLNKRAENFVDFIKNSERFISQQSIQSTIELPFSGNFINFNKYSIHCENNDFNTSEFFIENVQCSPWRSGPIFFFNLKHFIIKTSGEIVFIDDCYSWIKDPLLKTFFDKSNGLLNI